MGTEGRGTQRRYHHGNLAAVLIATGLDLVRRGGPAALTAREATRASGVSVAALYRHFASTEHWRAEVSRAAREHLAEAMLAALAEVDAADPDLPPDTRAARRFRASGQAYIAFALAEPDLFQAAFMVCGAPPAEPEEPSAWQVLADCLDALVDTGLLDPALREAAPLLAWTPVHGLAALLVQGALDTPDSAHDVPAAIETVLEGVRRSLALPDLDPHRTG